MKNYFSHMRYITGCPAKKNNENALNLSNSEKTIGQPGQVGSEIVEKCPQGNISGISV